MITAQELYFATRGLPKHEMIFVETGTFTGDMVDMALEFGFSEVRSVEIAEKYYNQSKERFSDEVKSGKVKLYHGDSADLLEKMIGKTKKRIVFWLDAHCSKGDTGGNDNKNPLIDELKTIKEVSSRNDHVIMVDDLHFVRGGWYRDHSKPFTEQELNDRIMDINSDYKFKYADCRTPITDKDTRKEFRVSPIDRNIVIMYDEEYSVTPKSVLIARTDWKIK